MLSFKPNQTLAFDGDSITCHRSKPCLDQWPWLRMSNNNRSWGDVLAELLFCWRPELNLKFRTPAVGGSTCRDVAGRFQEMIEPIKPDWAFMTLATNDASTKIPVTEFKNLMKDYAKICPNANEFTKESIPTQAPYFEAHLELASELNNVYTIDVGSGLLEKSLVLYDQYVGHDIYSDGTHLSSVGSTIVAGEVLKAFGGI